MFEITVDRGNHAELFQRLLKAITEIEGFSLQSLVAQEDAFSVTARVFYSSTETRLRRQGQHRDRLEYEKPCFDFAITLDAGETVALLNRTNEAIAGIANFELLDLVVRQVDGEVTASVYHSTSAESLE